MTFECTRVTREVWLMVEITFASGNRNVTRPIPVTAIYDLCMGRCLQAGAVQVYDRNKQLVSPDTAELSQHQFPLTVVFLEARNCLAIRCCLDVRVLAPYCHTANRFELLLLFPTHCYQSLKHVQICSTS